MGIKSLKKKGGLVNGKDETIWLNPGWLPFSYGFCPSENAWNESLKLMGINPDKNPFPSVDGCIVPFEEVDKGSLAIIITIKQSECPIKLLGLIVHEATHVWQHLKKHINEDTPSPELEAYSVQCITQEIISAALECWGLDVALKEASK